MYVTYSIFSDAFNHGNDALEKKAVSKIMIYSGIVPNCVNALILIMNIDYKKYSI